MCDRHPGKDSGCSLCPESWSQAEFEGNNLTHLEEVVSDRSVSKLWHDCCSLLTHRFTVRDSKNWRGKDRKGKKVCAV